MKCPYCDNDVPAGVNTCPACGANVPNNSTPAQAAQNVQGAQQIAPSGKSANTATILSCLIVGVGQMYLGQVAKGVVMLVASIILAALTGGISGAVTWIIGMVDAYKIGKKMEAGHSVGPWEFF